MLLWIGLISLVLMIVAFVVHKLSIDLYDIWAIVSIVFAIIFVISGFISSSLRDSKPITEENLAVRKTMVSIMMSDTDFNEMSYGNIRAVAEEIIPINEAIKWYDNKRCNCFYEGIIGPLDNYALIEVKDERLQRVIELIELSTD